MISFWCGLLVGDELDFEFRIGYLGRDSDFCFGAKSEVDVVIGDGGVAVAAGCGAGDILGVAVAFEDFAIGAEGEIVEGV